MRGSRTAALAVLITVLFVSGSFAEPHSWGQGFRREFSNVQPYSHHPIGCHRRISRTLVRLIGYPHSEHGMHRFDCGHVKGTFINLLPGQTQRMPIGVGISWEYGATAELPETFHPFDKFRRKFVKSYARHGQKEIGCHRYCESGCVPCIFNRYLYSCKSACLNISNWFYKFDFRDSQPRPSVSDRVSSTNFIRLDGGKGAVTRCTSGNGCVIHTFTHEAQLNKEQQGLAESDQDEAKSKKASRIFRQPSRPSEFGIWATGVAAIIGGLLFAYAVLRLGGLLPIEKHSRRKHCDS